MPNFQRLDVTTPTARELSMTRAFHAPRALVFDAYTQPELLRRWLGDVDGWILVTCEVSLRVGGAYRFVWRRDHTVMGVRGVYTDIVPPARVVATESFDDPWYEGDAVSATQFVEQAGITSVTTTIRYASQDVRDAVLRSPLQDGVKASGDSLARMLAAMVG